MSDKEEIRSDIAPLNIIRSETVLSRNPIHRLSKQGTPEIEIKKSNDKGEVTFKWEISHNSKYGQPGPLAYKVDTLVINRHIEEAGRPVPIIICLGSLKDISAQLGKAETRDTDTIKKALHQNAGTYITAKLRYQAKEGKERRFEFGGTRYNVVFTGEKLPDGTRADAVYIVLHDIYRELLNAAPVRPLDYDYLKDLPPTAQRFYELMSYQIFAAIQHGRPRAKYLYSEFCTFAPQTRYFEYEKVKKQMFKIHAPHRKAGYISKAEFEQTTDIEGQPDWLMFYTPGPKAKAEHKVFTRRGKPERLLKAPDSPGLKQEPGTNIKKNSAVSESTEEEALVKRLREHHIAEDTAQKLVKDLRESVIQQLEFFPYRDHSGIRDLSAWLIKAIYGNYEIPAGYAEAKAKNEKKRKAERKKAIEEARGRHREVHRAAFNQYLAAEMVELGKAYPEAYMAFNEHFEKFKQVLSDLEPETIEIYRFFDFEKFIEANPEFEILTFWQWDEQVNSEKFEESAA